MKCMVYRLDDPEATEFELQHNGNGIVKGQVGVEIDLKPEYISILEDAVLDTIHKTVGDDGKAKEVKVKKARFKVIKLEPELPPIPAKAADAAKVLTNASK